VNEVQSTLPERFQTAGKWNSYEITLEGSRIAVKLNGKTAVDARNDLFTSGTIALQANGPGSAGGAIRFEYRFRRYDRYDGTPGLTAWYPRRRRCVPYRLRRVTFPSNPIAIW
jgi:hypothetical protein